jgi:hypothetical protein
MKRNVYKPVLMELTLTILLNNANNVRFLVKIVIKTQKGI